MSSVAHQSQPVPPSISDLDWRAVGQQQADQVATLAAACVAVDGGLPVATEAEFLKSRYLSAEEAFGTGAYTGELYARIGFEVIGRRARYVRRMDN